MISLDILSKNILNNWSDTTDIIVLKITKDLDIVDATLNFQEHLKSFNNLQEIIACSHEKAFIDNVAQTLTSKKAISFNTNFSFNPEDVEDIPFSYKVVLEATEDENIIVIAEPIAPLSHEGAKIYYALINDYSNISRKLQKADFNLNKKNDELQEKIKEISYYANHDHLTQLYNRKKIFEELNKTYEKYQRTHEVFSLAVLDIDDFKVVNDTYGHQNGDKVLSSITQTLKEEFRVYDIIGRFGGEEFLVILPATKHDTALQTLERVIKKIASTSIELMNQKPLSVTISAGVAEIEDTHTVDTIVALADKRLYKAKFNGKNQVV